MPLYWGDIHGHSNLSDGRGTPEEYYEYGRTEAKLDFCALTDHVDRVASARLGLMPPESWTQIKDAAKKFHEPGKFVTLLGIERAVPSWDGHTAGNVSAYYKGDDGPFLLPKYPARDWLRPGALNPDAEMEQLWQALKAADCITAIHHSASGGHGYTWTKAPLKYQFDLIEIYSKWGSSEAPGAPFPISDGTSREQRPGGTAIDALNAGFRLGFVGGSGTHFAMPGSDIWENDWGGAVKYEKSGLTALYANELTRDAVFDALKNRRCYATNCERIQLLFTINDSPMGAVLTAPDKLRIHVRASGTREIKRAEVFKNGEITHHKIGGREELDMYFDENPPDKPAWYYVRVTQCGEGIAWSSPIWVVPAEA